MENSHAQHALIYAATYTVAFGSVCVLTPLAIRSAKHFRMIDLPDARKVHAQPMPRSGGIAIAAAFYAAALLSIFWISQIQHDATHISRLLILLCCAAAVFAVGMFDDMWNVPAKWKLIALLAASGILVRAGCILPLNMLGLTWLASVPALPAILTLAWLLAVSVSVNFIDGLDGLAAGIVAIAAGATAIGASLRGDLIGTSLSLALLGTLTGFLIFNFNPARVFMGDGGSMFIGFMLAAISTHTVRQSNDVSSLMPTLLALSIPLLDAALTLLRRRVLMRRSLFAAERGHVHHRLLDLGLDHRAAVLTVYCVTAIAACGGLIALFKNLPSASLAGVATLLFVLVFLRKVGLIRPRATWWAFSSNQNLERARKHYTHAFEHMQLRFARVSTFDEWWSEACAAADGFHFARMELRLPRRDGSIKSLVWTCTPDSSSDSVNESPANLAADSATAPAGTPVRPSDVVEVAVPVQQRRQNSAPLVINTSVITTSGLEHAGLRITMFLRLLCEHSLRSLASDATPAAEQPPIPLNLRPAGTEPSLSWQVAEQS